MDSGIFHVNLSFTMYADDLAPGIIWSSADVILTSWYNKAGHIPLHNGPGQLNLPVGQVDLGKVFFKSYIICIECNILRVREVIEVNFYPAGLKGSGVLSSPERAGRRQGRQAPLTLSRP